MLNCVTTAVVSVVSEPSDRYPGPSFNISKSIVISLKNTPFSSSGRALTSVYNGCSKSITLIIDCPKTCNVDTLAESVDSYSLFAILLSQVNNNKDIVDISNKFLLIIC